MDGMDADDLVQVVLDGHERCVIIFKQGGNEFYFRFQLDHLRGLMPMLIQAANESGPAVTSVIVKDAELARDTKGEALLTLTNTAGAVIPFSLTKAQCVQLSSAFDTLLADQSGSSRAH